MRNVAIELVRMSVVIFNAISLPDTWLMSTLLSLSSSCFLSFGPDKFCGDDELDDNKRELFVEGSRLTAF